MKKLLLAVLLPTLFLFSGCGSLSSQLRDVEHMRLVQTLGIDQEQESLQLSLASAARKSGRKRPDIVSGSGRSLSAALQRIRNYSSEEELFYAHVDQILLGEEAARQGIERILQYICHSAETRIDLPVFVLLDSSAKEAMEGVGNELRGPTEILQTLQTSLKQQGSCYLFTAADVLRNLERSGSALVCALEYAPAAEGGEEMTMAIAGYGILQKGVLVQRLDRDSALGATIALNRLRVCELDVKDQKGNPVSLELEQAKTQLRPVWGEDGFLRALELQVQVSAAVLEIAGKGGSLDDPQYEDHLIGQLEAAVSQRVQQALLLSKRLGADFLDLGSRLRYEAPARNRQQLQDFPSLLPQLEIRLSVSGKLSHSYDSKDT